MSENVIKLRRPDPPPIRTAYTDLGNAERFVRLNAGEVLFCYTWSKWLVWDRRRWKRDEDGEVLRRCKDTVRTYYHDAADCDDEDTRKRLATHARKSEASQRLRAIDDLARSEPEIAATHERFDAQPWLLTCRNGTVDLRTGKLHEARTDDYITHLVDAEYHPDATAPEWERFLLRVLGDDLELVLFVQRAIGYSLTGGTGEQCFFMLHGSGANGKSTFLEVIRDLLGPDLAQTARFETFMARRGETIPNDVARMKGARFITAIESEDGRRLSESTIKQLTGGDTVSARFMRAEFFEFQPTAKIWLAANHRPVIRGTDLAIWRRVKLIPFTVTIPEDERDPELPERLKRERAGILAWAIQGARQWAESGLGTCDAVEEHTKAYRTEQDVLGDFLSEECVIGRDEEVSKTVLYQRYQAWAERGGERYPLTARKLTERLRERGEYIREARRHGGVRVWEGIGLAGGDTGDTSEANLL